jgi:hypothetical protein
LTKRDVTHSCKPWTRAIGIAFLKRIDNPVSSMLVTNCFEGCSTFQRTVLAFHVNVSRVGILNADAAAVPGLYQFTKLFFCNFKVLGVKYKAGCKAGNRWADGRIVI